MLVDEGPRSCSGPADPMVACGKSQHRLDENILPFTSSSLESTALPFDLMRLRGGIQKHE